MKLSLNSNFAAEAGGAGAATVVVTVLGGRRANNLHSSHFCYLSSIDSLTISSKFHEINGDAIVSFYTDIFIISFLPTQSSLRLIIANWIINCMRFKSTENFMVRQSITIHKRPMEYESTEASSRIVMDVMFIDRLSLPIIITNKEWRWNLLGSLRLSALDANFISLVL